MKTGDTEKKFHGVEYSIYVFDLTPVASPPKIVQKGSLELDVTCKEGNVSEVYYKVEKKA